MRHKRVIKDQEVLLEDKNRMAKTKHLVKGLEDKVE